MFLLYLAHVIRNNPGVQEQRQMLYKCCIVDVITLVPLSPRTSDVATADAMTLIKVLHQILTFTDAMNPVKVLHKLVTFEDAITPVKGLHELVTLSLAFSSVTYFCFENKLL